MARIDTLSNFLSDIAESIRTKKGTTDKISPSNFDTEIESIQTGGGEPNLQEKSVVITENTTTDIIPDEDYDGLSKVSVTTIVSGGGNEPSNGIQIIKWDEEGYPTSIKCYGNSVLPYQFYNSSTSYSVPPTTISNSNNGFIGRLETIELNNVKILNLYAMYCIHPNNINLSKIESIANYGLYLRGGLKKFCLPNIRELGSSSIVDNYNNYYVWLGSNIYNDDYSNSWTNEALWKEHYWKIENGVLVDTGQSKTDTISYIACTYNKIFDVSNYIGRKLTLKMNWSGSPSRPSYFLYDKDYNIIKEGGGSIASGVTFLITDDVKYLVVCLYSTTATFANNNLSKFTLLPEQLATTTKYPTDLHILSNSFSSSKLQKLYIDLPRSIVEASSNYQNGFQGSNTDTARAKIVCNDDEVFLTQEEFEALIV